jgi:hypothetical protein
MKNDPLFIIFQQQQQKQTLFYIALIPKFEKKFSNKKKEIYYLIFNGKM